MSSLGDALGNAAVDIFIKPQLKKFVESFVAKETHWTPAQKAAKAIEMETGLLDALELGINMATTAKATQ